MGLLDSRKIMDEKEFKRYLEQTERRINLWRENGCSEDWMRCRLIYRLGYGDNMFTVRQIRRLFNLTFDAKKGATESP